MITISKEMANAIWDFMVEHKFKEVVHILVPFQQMVGPQISAAQVDNNIETTNNDNQEFASDVVEQKTVMAPPSGE